MLLGDESFDPGADHAAQGLEVVLVTARTAHAGAFALHAHQSSIAQDGQVFGATRLADANQPSQFADAALAMHEVQQQADARLVGQGAQPIGNTTDTQEIVWAHVILLF